MEKVSRKNCLRSLFLVLLVMIAFTAVPARETKAATAGFTTVGGKSYYIKKDGSKQKGWLTLGGRKYYFNTKTGVQLKGWQKDSSGKKIRYFTSGKGYMITGFLKDSAGNTRYFAPATGLMVRGWMTDGSGDKYYFTSGAGVMMKGWVTNGEKQKRYFSKADGRMLTGWRTDTKGNNRFFNTKSGIMYTGIKKVSNYYYYFVKSTGARYQKGFATVSNKKYYFSPKNGRAQTGWLTLSGKKYYFNSKGVMYANTTANVDGKAYSFDSNGVASEAKYTVEGEKVRVQDKNGSFLMAKEFLTHPGVANGELKDVDLLAALCDAEANDQGKIGMEAVALCVLNRSVKADKEFPSDLRYNIYLIGPYSYPQYSPVRDGALLRRLNGQFENRTLAYAAAQEAMKIFDAYVLNGKPRKLVGFKNDFNYMYFMMESSFYAQDLNFKKVESFLYKDHMFFVDWVSP